jgi:transposase-like protein
MSLPANRRVRVYEPYALRTVDGPVTVELPRDRDASFEPRIVPKHGRSFDGFDEQILALYASAPAG